MTDINLLPEEEKATESFELLKKRLTFASVALLVLTSVATLAVLIFFTIVGRNRAELIATIEDATVRINSFKANEELQYVTKNKAAVGEQILNSRIDVPNVFAKLASLVPQNAYFTDMKMAGNKLTIGGKAKTSADMAGLISSLVSADASSVLSQVVVETLVSDEGGVYTFTLSAQVVKK